MYIKTKYLGPTDTKGARIKLVYLRGDGENMAGTSRTIERNYEFDHTGQVERLGYRLLFVDGQWCFYEKVDK